MSAFHGQMGMFVRAAAYMLSHGADGLRQASGDAVLNANYVLRRLEDVLEAPFAAAGPCMHEALFSDAGFAGGLSTLDLAKGLIDEGFHPMTMYFPLVVHGAMLIEPTETESKAGLDQLIGAIRALAAARPARPARRAPGEAAAAGAALRAGDLPDPARHAVGGYVACARHLRGVALRPFAGKPHPVRPEWPLSLSKWRIEGPGAKCFDTRLRQAQPLLSTNDVFSLTRRPNNSSRRVAGLFLLLREDADRLFASLDHVLVDHDLVDAFR